MSLVAVDRTLTCFRKATACYERNARVCVRARACACVRVRMGACASACVLLQGVYVHACAFGRSQCLRADRLAPQRTAVALPVNVSHPALVFIAYFVLNTSVFISALFIAHR
jgi:hypothetical protein